MAGSEGFFSPGDDSQRSMQKQSAEDASERLYFGVEEHTAPTEHFEHKGSLPTFNSTKAALKGMLDGLDRGKDSVVELVDQSVLSPMEKIFRAQNLLRD
ncbi:MAG: hypothetical protein K2X77_07900 [Candidatus Obscuribacterales bacterium]|jgi:hypothetical protein|nr:hypothetical protein [Candidatus Obscuribacterales bacterium]